MQKILLISRNLPPLRGGMERLNYQMAIELAEGCQLSVIGPRGCKAGLSGVRHVSEIPHRPLWRFLLAALFQSIIVALQNRPDVVLAGSGLTAPLAWIAARLARAKFVVYLHGLDIIVDHKIYHWLWRPFLRRCDLCLTNSQHTKKLAQEAGIDGQSIHILHPGVGIPELNPGAGASFRKQHRLSGKTILLAVGRITPRKGLLEFVENCLPAIVSGQGDVVLVVIGEDAGDALRGGGIGMTARIIEASRRRQLQDHVLFLGGCDDAVLATAYQAADLHIFPVQDIPGDVEGFGMVCLEAAAYGLPTVAFAVGGVPDAVAKETGILVLPGDYPVFTEAVLRTVKATRSEYDDLACRKHAAQYSWAIFGKKIRDVLTQCP